MTTTEQKITEILERNRRVESDKAWETSWSRRLAITVFTYFVALIFMQVAGLKTPVLSAFIPAGGYFLSTLSIPFLKQFWIERIHQREETSS